ncbi:Fur-regulated basic protein FbpA [Alkalihalobacillus sp. LMS39]|uniref:Fur-regulated basic protein FbpA n=1 Tax=Alkalihalobacillus sp. LMS39 TaxID=2924032 RepID=UPI001FB31B1E|nr:Fur-regulated basic protein FbpA [Alkalihalobacillus sp. LMS39]UOE96058.1 Fur-regulated basic protein FbpA [Alkalihalobacillus sp. LMS39]
MEKRVNMLRFAVEEKKKELIKLLKECGIHHNFQGEKLENLTLTELEEKFRKVAKY